MSTELFGFTLFVHDQVLAKDFFLHALGFHLVQDTGLDKPGDAAKRRLVVSPCADGFQSVLVQAQSAAELALLGKQAAGKVLFYLKTSDIQACYTRNTRLRAWCLNPRLQSNRTARWLCS